MSFIDVAAIVGGIALEAGASEAAAAGIGAVAEGALTGSALGAATSALTGQDVGKGALFGALGGGVTSGLGAAFGGGAGGAASTEAAGLRAAGNLVDTPVASYVESGAPSITDAGRVGITNLPSAGATNVPTGSWNVMGDNSILGGASKLGNIPVPETLPPQAGGFGAFSNAPVESPVSVENVFGKTPAAFSSASTAEDQALSNASKELGKSYQDRVRDQLSNTFYGKHNFAVPAFGATVGSLFNTKPTSATPPNLQNQWNPWGNYYNFNPRYYAPSQPTYIGPSYAEGGITSLNQTNPDPGMMASGNPKLDFMGQDAFPTSQQKLNFYATPTQMPTSAQQAAASYEPATNPLTGEPVAHFADGGFLTPFLDADPSGASRWLVKNTPQIPFLSKALFGDPSNQNPNQNQNFASGGISDLGGYSDGGRLTRGPGDGMSDDIPANIAGKQQARLAQGEFVVPADVVSHLGNGSTDAGAKQLYLMMDRVRKARTGRKAQGKQINARRQMPV